MHMYQEAAHLLSPSQISSMSGCRKHSHVRCHPSHICSTGNINGCLVARSQTKLICSPSPVRQASFSRTLARSVAAAVSQMYLTSATFVCCGCPHLYFRASRVRYSTVASRVSKLCLLGALALDLVATGCRGGQGATRCQCHCTAEGAG